MARTRRNGRTEKERTIKMIKERGKEADKGRERRQHGKNRENDQKEKER